MKRFILVLLLFVSWSSWAQDSIGVIEPIPYYNTAYQRGSYMGTLSFGFINGYRSDYEVPAGFEKGIVTGFTPIFAKAEYAASNRFSLALTAAFSTIIYHNSQLYPGFGGMIMRGRANKFKMFSGGITAFYHLGHIIHVKNLDPFIGVGINLNNLSYSAHPQGDSTVMKTSHTATAYAKIGARYYISNKFSVFADAGYDKLSMVSVGVSCRFFSAANKK